MVKNDWEAAGRIPIEGVLLNAEVFDDSVIPGPQKYPALIARHARASGVVDAEIPFYQAVARDVAGAEHCNAIALCVVSVAVENRIVCIAPIDVEGAAVDAGAIGQKRLALAD